MSRSAAAPQTVARNASAAGSEVAREAPAPASRWRKWYVLGVLILIGLFNYIDRQSLAILQIPIKRELGLSDTQLGALTGLAFAFLFLPQPKQRFSASLHRGGTVLCAALRHSCFGFSPPGASLGPISFSSTGRNSTPTESMN